MRIMIGVKVKIKSNNRQQRSNDVVLVGGVQIRLKREECALALGMGQSTNDAVVTYAQIKPSVEECALSTGQRQNNSASIDEAKMGLQGLVEVEVEDESESQGQGRERRKRDAFSHDVGDEKAATDVYLDSYSESVSDIYWPSRHVRHTRGI